MNNKTNNLTGIQSNKIDSMCFYCFSWQFMCVWCVWGWNSFTIRPSFPRKSDCLTPAMPLWLSSNTSLHGFMGYAIYGYYQSNLLYFLSLLFDMVIDWWVQFCQTNFYSSKWKSFLAFIHEQWNICIRRNWRMARNICINKHKVTSLNSQTSEKKHMRWRWRWRRRNRMMKNVPLFAQNLNLFK